MASKILKELLSNLNIFCTRCVFRYTTFNEAITIRNVEETHQKHCGSCLGILEQQQIEDTVKKVSTELLEKGFEIDTFALAISLPQCIVLREKAMVAYIKENELYDVKPCHTKNELSIKEVLKSILLSQMSSSTSKTFSKKSPLLISLEYCYTNEEKEIKMIDSLLPKPSKKRKFQHRNNKQNQKSPLNNIQLVTETINGIHDSNLKKYTQVPPTTIETPCELKIRITHEPIYLAGRYNKYSRELSQTPWITETGRKTEHSVQELICKKLIEHTKCEEVKFMSSGREDSDVRMLGRGRPFVIGLLVPKFITISLIDVRRLQKEINQSTKLVSVRDLQIINKDGLTQLKSGEQEKTKCYSAKVWCPEIIDDEKLKSLNSLSNITLHQTTPIRVVHRRPLLVRDRMVYSLNLTRLDDEYHYLLKLKTEAGTYIKEFVHSDFGRTSPSLCTLMDAPFDILELDVDEVEFDWPPKVDDEEEAIKVNT